MSVPVLLMADGVLDRELESALGEERSAALRADLTQRAVSVAREFAGADPEQGRALSELAGRDGPLLVLWAAVPRLSREHLDGAADDLRAGCDLVFGPLMGGGFYLLGLARPLPDVLAAVEENPSRDDATAAVLALAGSRGLEIGYLRPERPLRSPEDVPAALVDPLLPAPLLGLLAGPPFEAWGPAPKRMS